MMASVDCNLDDAVPTTTKGGTCANSDLNRNSWDPGWNYGTFFYATNKDEIKYKLCGFISKGGITRLKHHIARIQRKCVATCKKASVEDKANLVDALDKERTYCIHQYCARWIYESGIPFHSIDNDGFKKFVEAVGQYGRGYRPLSQYQLRKPLLKEEVERTKGLLKKQEEEWARYGCLVMTDGWTDRKRRSIMNFYVNSRKGTTFLSLVECSTNSHTWQFIFEYVDKGIKDVGSQNVIQVVTDNVANNMAAAQLLEMKKPNIFWTSCAAHTIDLMLEAIGKEGKFKEWIAKAKTLTIFIYAHHRTLMDKKEKLRLMFTSDEWTQSKWAKTKNGKEAYSIPSMGFLYGELKKAKEDIKMAFNNVETYYRPIIDIIETRSKGRLDSPLHLIAYLLNPYYFFKDQRIKDDVMVSNAVYAFLEKLFHHDFEKQDQVMNIELPKYKGKEGDFGRMLAAKGCSENNSSYDPGAAMCC
ncbi:putative transcription factor/ chromatin remodeling BED-type(Zn) family protein [Tanacetum coccineum]|uniref:Transcription factor/ chromatin remodeling BED-type(Zn) family protein n=1 Tax=Tanacetum coccineum TaxID=301880 RepID=A0ABQ5B1D4_9ASTR